MKEIAVTPGLPSVSATEKQALESKSRAEGSFARFLEESIEQVNGLQKEATLSVEALATGTGENIHETMIALEKAELSFKMMMQVRNKIIKAYEEVMRMQV
ncbi:MAG: flagellar hook-basal body complex protein FliE [bacterium]|nr:flagellar hook-basal body complex protein FliE [bacterium]